MNLSLSVCILTSRRLPLLQACLKSVYPALPEDGEVIVIVNGPDEDTIAWLEGQTDPRLRWVAIPTESRSRARNRAFVMCRGDIIHWLDDDVVVPDHLFRRAVELFSLHPEMQILGGPNLTPPDSSRQEKLFGAVMTSFFAAPMIRARYAGDDATVRPATEHDLILCNLAVRASAIPPGLRFKPMRSNEENLFLFECSGKGLKAAYSPDMYVYHRRRPTFSGFCSQTASYGHGRAQQLMFKPRSCHPAFLVPALLWVLIPELFLLPWGMSVFAILASLHVVLSIAGALRSSEARSLGWYGVIGTSGLTALVHALYGFGFWRGVFLTLARGVPALIAEAGVRPEMTGEQGG